MANCAVIKESIRIEDIIGRVVPLKQHGHWYVGRCPFHHDTHPSFVVWPETGTWKCMTCSTVRDDVIGFVAKWRGCSTAEALTQLQDELPAAPVQRPTPPGSPVVASLAHRDATYRTVLAHWGLTHSHYLALRKRGLSDLTIRQAGFASVVPGHTTIHPTTVGIPGFARQGGRWRIIGPAGLAIPVRALDGRIQAVHIRTDAKTAGKYRWLSTPDRMGGAASGAPVHVARGVDDVVWVTEGPLKAIVAQERLKHTVLGVAGVSAWQDVPEIVATLRPRRVILAFDQDADPATAAVVAQQTVRLTDVLRGAGWIVLQAQWTGPKGLDDALVAEAHISTQ